MSWDSGKLTDLFALFRGFQLLQHLEDKPDRPLSRAAVQGKSNRRCFQNLFSAGTKVSSTADMEFDSAITLLRDADAQCNKLLVFPGQGAVFQGIRLEIFKFAKGADSAAKHELIVFLASFPDVADVIEHGFLQEFVRSLFPCA